MTNGVLSARAEFVLQRLSTISRGGPIEAVGDGDRAVGMTLLAALGVQHKTTEKPKFNGVVLTARRGNKMQEQNRVNLFASVPNWSLSSCKSSSEIVSKYGYDRDGGRKLYCTVRARQPNAQGLMLVVDKDAGLLREVFVSENRERNDVACWKLPDLADRLLRSHPESAWVVASVTQRNGKEYFHYRYARFTSEPKLKFFSSLIDSGTVTVDHLIFDDGQHVVEKGPLFKLLPQNVSALFAVSPVFDLMRI